MQIIENVDLFFVRLAPSFDVQQKYLHWFRMNIPSTKLLIVGEHRAEIDFIFHLIIYLTIHSFEIQEISHYLNLLNIQSHMSQSLQGDCRSIPDYTIHIYLFTRSGVKLL